MFMSVFSFVDQSFSTYKSDYNEWDNIESWLEEDVDETVKSFIEKKFRESFYDFCKGEMCHSSNRN